MIINNTYLRKLIKSDLGIEKDNFSEEELSVVNSLNIEEKIDFEELLNLKKLEVLRIYNMELDGFELSNISKLENLKELYLINCPLESISYLSGMTLNTLFISNTIIDDIEYINTINIKNLFLEYVNTIDLDKLSIIRNLEGLSLNNTKVINETKMIFMDKIVNLSLVNTGIKFIDSLIDNETLKLLVIDEDIYANNKIAVRELKNNNVLVVDDMNQQMGD